MIWKLFDRLSDERLNTWGLRYNWFCLIFVLTYGAVVVGLILTQALGWGHWGRWAFVVQVGWVPIYVPNLVLMSVRVHRNYRDHRSVCERIDAIIADAENTVKVEMLKRLAYLRGDDPPDDQKPTLN